MTCFGQVRLDSRLRRLRRCGRLVVMIGLSGAVLLEDVNETVARCQVVLDPLSLNARRPGVGAHEADLTRFHTAWMTASIVADLVANHPGVPFRPFPDLRPYLQRGLARLRRCVTGAREETPIRPPDCD